MADGESRAQDETRSDPRPSQKMTVLRWTVAVVLIGSFVYLGRSYFGEFRRLLDVSPWIVAALFGIFMVTRFLNGVVYRLAARRLGAALDYWEAFVLVMTVSYLNLLLPKAGLTAPAIYLKRRYGVTYTRFTSTLLPTVVLQVMAFGVAGAVCQGVLNTAYGTPVHVGLLILFLGLVAVGALITVVPVQIPNSWQNRVAAFFQRIFNAWRLMQKSYGLIVRVLGIQIVVILLRGLRLHMAFLALGETVNFVAALVVSLLSQLAMLISLTPGALGFREGAIMYGSFLIGLRPDMCLAAAVLDRAVMTASQVVIGQMGLWFMFGPALKDSARRSARSSNEEPET